MGQIYVKNVCRGNESTRNGKLWPMQALLQRGLHSHRGYGIISCVETLSALQRQKKRQALLKQKQTKRNERIKKMDISKFKVIWYWIWGGMDSVVEYARGIVNYALDQIDINKKAKIVAAYNTIQRVLAVLQALKWLCPTKWQTAYSNTIVAVATITASLTDFKIEAQELADVKKKFEIACESWKSEDNPDEDLDFSSPEVRACDDNDSILD